MITSLKVATTAATAYTAAFVAGTAISVKRGYIAEALGIRSGRSVRQDVAMGLFGAALAPPWSMIVQMWLAVRLASQPGRPGRGGRAWLAILAAMFVAGSVAEPISHKVLSRQLPAPDSMVAVANVVLPATMLVGAVISLVSTEDR